MNRNKKIKKILKNKEYVFEKIKIKKIPKNEEDTFEKIKAKMDKIGIYEVMICNGCDYLRDNKLGLYCRDGNRRIRRFNEFNKIVCLDCDANKLDRLQVSKEEFYDLERRKI